MSLTEKRLDCMARIMSAHTAELKTGEGHEACWTGQQACEVLIKYGYVKDLEEAVDIGTRMLEYNIIVPVEENNSHVQFQANETAYQYSTGPSTSSEARIPPKPIPKPDVEDHPQKKRKWMKLFARGVEADDVSGEPEPPEASFDEENAKHRQEQELESMEMIEDLRNIMVTVETEQRKVLDETKGFLNQLSDPQDQLTDALAEQKEKHENSCKRIAMVKSKTKDRIKQQKQKLIHLNKEMQLLLYQVKTNKEELEEFEQVFHSNRERVEALEQELNVTKSQWEGIKSLVLRALFLVVAALVVIAMLVTSVIRSYLKGGMVTKIGILSVSMSVVAYTIYAIIT